MKHTVEAFTNTRVARHRGNFSMSVFTNFVSGNTQVFPEFISLLPEDTPLAASVLGAGQKNGAEGPALR